MPFMGKVPDNLKLPVMDREQSARAVAMYLGHDPEPEIMADWPTDIELFCGLLSFAPGLMVRGAATCGSVCCSSAPSARPRTALSRTMRCTTRGRCGTML